MTALVRIALLAILVNSAALMPAAAQSIQSRNWSGACTGCHGTEGRSAGAIPADNDHAPIGKRTERRTD